MTPVNSRKKKNESKLQELCQTKFNKLALTARVAKGKDKPNKGRPF